MDNAERDQEMAQMWDAGLGLTQIANEMSISTAVVRRVLQASGREVVRLDKLTRKKVDVQEVIDAYLAGSTIKAIRKRFQISVAMVYNILSDNDVPTRKVANVKARDRQLDEAVQMYKDGHMLKVILDETGIHQPTLHNALHRRGITLRRPRGKRQK